MSTYAREIPWHPRMWRPDRWLDGFEIGVGGGGAGGGGGMGLTMSILLVDIFLIWQLGRAVPTN